MARASIADFRRQELERAAYETACELGFGGMTLEHVAKQAGISKGLIHHHFENKEDLIVGMIRYANRIYSEMARMRIKTARSASERLWGIIDSHLAPGFFLPQLIRAYLPALFIGVHHKEILRVYDATNERGRANVAFALKSFMSAEDAKAASHTIWNFLEGVWILPASQPELTRPVLLKMIAGYLARSIRGFDISVVDLGAKNDAAPSTHTQARVPTSTIRRMELEQAALNIIHERGLRELTIQRVAEEARLSKGVVHHYFLNKDELVAGAMRHANRKFGQEAARLLSQTKTASERLWTVVAAQLADEYLQLSYLRSYLSSLESGFRNSAIMRIYDISERRGRSNIAFALRQLMAPEDVRTTTLTLWNLIEGAWFLLFAERISREKLLLSLAEYINSSIPAFDRSVLGFQTGPSRSGVRRTIPATERDICVATAEVAEHVGYRQLTIELVAEHLGISKEAMTRNYPNQAALVAASVRYANQQAVKLAQRRLKEAKSPSEELWAFVHTELSIEVMKPGLTQAYIALLEAGIQNRAILDTYETTDSVRMSRMVSILRKMDAKEAERTAFSIASMLEGAWRLLPCDPGTTRKAILNAISQYINSHVPGFESSAMKLSDQWDEEAGELSQFTDEP